ncbi:aconitase family protein [Streptomyces sp. RB17]|uniref:aconitase family protein n=1 Tax=Streptomyces sp. RB17 TaxID=2585197 RepID=UPI002B21A522|nr:aconitase family protein [Streptomyces sp. RB17]
MKTSASLGSRVGTDYLDAAGLTPYRENLGFHLTGYGSMTCIGASGTLAEGEHEVRRPGARPFRGPWSAVHSLPRPAAVCQAGHPHPWRSSDPLGASAVPASRSSGAGMPSVRASP